MKSKDSQFRHPLMPQRDKKMRWKSKPLPDDGETRIVEKFLFLPYRDGRTDEIRWLEKAKVKEKCSWYEGSCEWKIIEFAD